MIFLHKLALCIGFVHFETIGLEHDDSGAHVNGADADETAVAEPQPEPPRELTLEEWKAQHKSEQPQFNIRRPGEGDDKKLYQKLVPIKRATALAKSDGKAAAAAAEEEEKVFIRFLTKKLCSQSSLRKIYHSCDLKNIAFLPIYNNNFLSKK